MTKSYMDQLICTMVGACICDIVGSLYMTEMA